MFVAIWEFAPFPTGSPGSGTTILLIPKNPELKNPLPETKCDKSIHYLSMTAGLSSIKHRNIAQGVTHPVIWTPGTRHHPVIYWLPGWRFTASRNNWWSECEREAISLRGPGISVCWLRDQILFSACQWFYGCGIMIFDAGCTVVISAKLQAWNWNLRHQRWIQKSVEGQEMLTLENIWKPGKMPPEVQNKGISNPTKRDFFFQKLTKVFPNLDQKTECPPNWNFSNTESP